MGILPPSGGSGLGSGSGSGGSGGESLSKAIQSISLKVASGTLSLTGLRAWDSLMRQIKVGQAETGSLSLTTTYKTLHTLLLGTQGLGKSDPGLRDVVGYGPIVMPFEADAVTVKFMPEGAVNDPFTPPVRTLGYGEMLTVGQVPPYFPKVLMPLWVYAFNFPVAASVDIMLRDMHGQTTYEANVAGVTGDETVGSLAGTGNLAGAIECHIFCDQEFYWNYGGKHDATIQKSPVGARRMTADTESLFGEVAWPKE